MTSSVEINVNTAWCRTIAAELARLGVRDAVVSPGSRSAAMVSAMRERGDIRLFVQTDERSAAFFAHGLILATARPVVTCVTSGSAVANLLPALTESHALGLPLVIVSCDRPKHLRNRGLPQTTKQVEFVAPLVQAACDLPDPSPDAAALDALGQEVAGLAGPLARGPVQINLPLAGKLSSVDGIHGWQRDVAAPAPCDAPAPALPAAAPPFPELDLHPGMRGLIVAGPDGLIDPTLIRSLADSTGFPLLADAPGSLRGRGIPGTIAEADLMITRPEFFRSQPDLIIRLGSVPVARSLQQFLESATAPVLLIDRKPVAAAIPGVHRLASPDGAAMARLTDALGRGDAAWRTQWLEAAQAIRLKLSGAIDALPWSEIQAVEDTLTAGGYDFLHISNSLSLRLVNFLLPASETGMPIYANRGVSGIDGTFGTFFGELAGHGGAGLLLLGDLSALHDLPALEAVLHQQYRGVIVILNNGGAGLFDMLPIRTVPEYERLIRNHIPVDFGLIAQAFGLAYTRCADRPALRQALGNPLRHDRLHVIEVVVPKHAAALALPKLLSLMADSAS
jgi:2-succinyl-5-enolpyruvyl-6-hydroxy-3-cyclohexene-1-carboxylate synthase